MHPGAKLVVGAALVVGVPWALLVLVSLGPSGWLAIGTVLAVVGVARLTRARDDAEAPALINCPACGAPNDPDATACPYCGQPTSRSD